MVLSGSTSPMHCIPSPTQLQHPPRDDPTISRWLLLRFVSRCIEQTKLNDGSLTKALPAGCQQHRLEAYLRHMHQMLDGIAEISYPVHQAISIDNLSAQKLSLEQHQKQLKGPHHHHRQQQPSKSHIFDQDAQETHTTSLSQQGDVYADTDADADADAIRTAAIARHRHDVLNLPLYLPTHSSKSGGSAVSETLLGEMELQPLRKRKTGSERSELFRNSESRENSVDTSDTAGHTTNALALILERNRKLQDGLSGDLARHAEQLKMTSLLFETNSYRRQAWNYQAMSNQPGQIIRLIQTSLRGSSTTRERYESLREGRTELASMLSSSSSLRVLSPRLVAPLAPFARMNLTLASYFTAYPGNGWDALHKVQTNQGFVKVFSPYAEIRIDVWESTQITKERSIP
ncbi:hypothetical protein BASA61_008216 [Batrachochytrium salamandrivorans]|nr:hypothetical protein BASA61_008216 [Batrachochytrium salamandrivorans]